MKNLSLNGKLSLLLVSGLILYLMLSNLILYFSLNYYDETSSRLRWVIYSVVLPFATALGLGWIFNRILNSFYLGLVDDFKRHFFNNFFVFAAVWNFFALSIQLSESWGIRSEWHLQQRGNLVNIDLKDLNLEASKSGHWSFKQSEALDKDNLAYYTYSVSKTENGRRSTQDFHFWALPLSANKDLENLSIWWVSRLEAPKLPLEQGIKGGRLVQDSWAKEHFMLGIAESKLGLEPNKNYVFLEENTEDFESLSASASQALIWSFTWYNLSLTLVLGLWAIKGWRTFKV